MHGVHERFFEHCLRVLWLAGAASSAARLARLLRFWHVLVVWCCCSQLGGALLAGCW